MAFPTVVAQGDQATPDTTEVTLGGASILPPGYYEVTVDLAAMQASDTVVLRFKKKAKANATLRQAKYFSFSNAQDNSTDALSAVKILGPFASQVECSFTLQRTAGANRTFPWMINQAG